MRSVSIATQPKNVFLGGRIEFHAPLAGALVARLGPEDGFGHSQGNPCPAGLVDSNA